MRLVIFGLTVSSSWGNGHATLWRGLIRALTGRGHEVIFFERDVPYYAAARDLHRLEGGGRLVLYADWSSVLPAARASLRGADAAIVTSYCPDARFAADLIRSDAFGDGAGVSVFYDLDSPVTLAALRTGEWPPYLPAGGLAGFDLVLSYAGGRALTLLASELGASRVAPLYGHADAAFASGCDPRQPAGPDPPPKAALSFLGTYAADRQAALEKLFLAPAAARPELQFLIAGAGYGAEFPWRHNIHYKRHLAPCDHAAVYLSSRLTLNITREAMADIGYAPSGRLFEAALAGAAIVSDAWEGLETFFAPGEEILVARSADDVLAAIELPDATLTSLGRAARARVLAEHTSDARAQQLLALIADARTADAAQVAGTRGGIACGA